MDTTTIDTVDIKDVADFISADIINTSSLIAVKIIDISSFEVVYVNQAMRSIMADKNAKNCWEAMYAQETPCPWCKVTELSRRLLHPEDEKNNPDTIMYEHFNEVANKWYQIQEKILVTEQGQKLLVSIGLDINMQKEVQSQLISSHVQLSRKTQALNEAQEALKIQASHDYLTNVHNRRYFQLIAKDMIRAAKREDSDLSVIMIDVDRFKQVNDTYGHSVGDQTLKHIVSILCETVRESDIVARIGGEEFAILPLSTDLEGAAELAEKLREAVSTHPVRIDDKTDIPVTISLGVASVDVHTDINIDNSLNTSDQALYKAKQSGRNKVAVYSG